MLREGQDSGGYLMKRILALLAVALLCYGVTNAQESITVSGTGLPDSLFSPQLILESKEQIGLTQDQLDSLKGLSDQMESETQGTGKVIAPVSEKLLRILSASHVNESDAMTFVDIILDLERQYRAKQILYLIKVKNILSEDQQKQLMEIRARK